MTTNKLNLFPGIDWTNESVKLRTSAGVIHSAKGELSAHPVTIQQQWGALGLDITPTDDYLSITAYSTEDLSCSYRVGDFKKILEEKNNGGRILKPWIGLRSYYYGRRNRVEYNDGLQLRIYKDFKMTMLRSALLPDGDTKKKIYYVIEKFDEEKAFDFPQSDTSTAQSMIAEAKEVYDFTLVETDEEVKNLRKTLPLKSVNNILENFGKNSGDLRSGFIDYISPSYETKFCQATIDILHEWFGYDKKENGFRKSYFLKKAANAPINTLWRILLWCASPSKERAQTVDKEGKAEEIIAYYQDFLEDPRNHNVQLWDRRGDDIILLRSRQYTGEYYFSNSRPTIFLFVYNTKTKKRFYGEKFSQWSFPIPALARITDDFYSKPFKEKGSRVIFRKPVKQIFANTNVDWCLTNAANVLIRNDFKKNWGDPDQLLTFETYFNTVKGPIILGILATSGILLFEQLLKAKLFNLYFAALTEAMGSNLARIFPTGTKYVSSSGILYYNEKGKNLQTMFNIPLRVLRIINDKTVFEERTYGRSEKSLDRITPNMCDFVRKFGEQLASADDKTLQFWIEKSTVHIGNFIHYLETIKQAFPNITTLSEYKQLFEKYNSKINLFRDYFSMREKLKRYQEEHPEREGVFSEKKYPAKPEKATRFLPYIENMLDRDACYYPYCVRRMTPGDFVYKMEKNRFKDAFKEGRGSLVYSDAGRLLGASVKMTPGENLSYLHDELSYWLRFFQDATKDVDFKKATERVKDLEWKDSKTGLEIVAPASIHELQEEGAVLSHCVASYADAIIDGTENIMFLRRTDMPDSPYYTVEVLPRGEIRQVHCFGNGDLTEGGQREAYRRSQYSVYDRDFDIVGFLTKWARAFPGRINASTVRSRYGALCAIRR